jgi:hypothetical protein
MLAYPFIPFGISRRINSREGSSRSTATENSKGQNEHHDLRSTIQSRGDNVVVLDKELRALPPQVVLGEETEGEEHRDGRVDTDKEVTHLPQDDRGVDVPECCVRIKAIGEPKGNRDKETKQVGDRDPLVFGADGESVTCNTPSDSQGVELLYVLAGPDVGASESFQDGSLVVDDPANVLML